jgi:hypothetical protein
MAARRRAAVPVVVLFVLASLGASARAQFGDLLKKTLPKPATATTPPPAKKLYCEDITPEKVEQLLKGLRAERAAHEKAQAMDKAAKATQAAGEQAAPPTGASTNHARDFERRRTARREAQPAG